MGYLVTTSQLVTDIKNTAYFPVDQNVFTPQTILDIANDELYSDILPLFKSFNEGFYLEVVSQSFVAGQAAYTLPKYAMWNAVYLVQRTTNGIPVWPDYERIEIVQLSDYQTNQPSTPIAYYLLNDTVVFVPTPQTGVQYAFNMWIYRRPGRMVPTSSAAEVLSVNKVTGEVTYTAIPPATFTATSTHDFYAIQPPFRRLQTNITATAIAGAVQTFPVASVQTLSTGDWVCLLDETVIPPVPPEIVPFLKDLTIKALAKTQGDYEAYGVQKQEVVDKMKAAIIVPGNRTVGKSKRILAGRNPLARALPRRFF